VTVGLNEADFAIKTLRSFVSIRNKEQPAACPCFGFDLIDKYAPNTFVMPFGINTQTGKVTDSLEVCERPS